MVNSSTCVIVLGGHRCGTSAVAGVLHKLGVFMGHRFVGKTKFNTRGHFEDIAFLNLNKRIVGGWKRPCVDWEPVRKPYTKLVRARERNFPIWGYKDPRMCFVFPYFQQICQSRLLVINIYRDLEATAKSMRNRRKAGSSINIASDVQALKIARHYRDAQSLAMQKYKGLRLDVKYNTLVSKPADEVARIAEFIGLNITVGAIEFIDANLRHF